MKKIGIYVRVSTQEQAKEGYSIGEQIDRLKKYSSSQDWTIYQIYTDAGYSGATKNRPALQNLIEDVKSGKIEKVLVYKLDRLSRSQKDTLELIEDVFLTNNCDFESMTERFDTSTSFGRAIVGILAVFAQLEREQIKERMSMGLTARIKEGKWHGGGKVPFGYDYDQANNKLIINEYEALLIKNIFNDFIEGKSMYQIAAKMQESGTKVQCEKTYISTLRYILKNKTYCGYLRNKDKWEPGLHDAIISESTYEKAQIILNENKKKYEEQGIISGKKGITTYLGGLIYCAKCGAKYSKSTTGCKKYKTYTYYSCYSKNKKTRHLIKDPNCGNKSYQVEDLDKLIFDQIRQLAIDPNYIKQLKNDSEKISEQNKIEVIEKQLKSISSQISRLMDLYSFGQFDIEQLDDKIKSLTEQKVKLQNELNLLQNDSEQMTEKEVMKLVKSFDEVLSSGDFYAIRTVVESLINKIVIDGDDIAIHWNFT